MKTLHDGTEVSDDTPTKLVDGKRYRLSDGEAAELTARTKAPISVDDVQREAERRIDAGFTLNGSTFKCDDRSATRVDGMVRRFMDEEAAGRSYSAKFRTNDGASYNVTTAAQAKAIANAMTDYIVLILGKSDALQAMDPIPSDYTDDSYWTS